MLHRHALTALNAKSVFFAEHNKFSQGFLDELMRRKLLRLEDGRLRYRHDIVRAFFASHELLESPETVSDPALAVDINWAPCLTFAILMRQEIFFARDITFRALKRSASLSKRVFNEVEKANPRLSTSWKAELAVAMLSPDEDVTS